MILKFPDINSLRLALITRAVPAAMSQTGAVVAFDEQGPAWVETSATLGRGNLNELKKLGALGAKAFPAGVEKFEVSSWPEALPLEREDWTSEALAQAPVLFDLCDGTELSRVVTEALRLGNDRQGYRWLDAD